MRNMKCWKITKSPISEDYYYYYIITTITIIYC
jgi:hypothetical protein